MDGYTIDVCKRCLDWGRSDEGKIFWRWLEMEATRLHNMSMQDINSNPIAGIINSQKNLAREEEVLYVGNFLARLEFLIREKEKNEELLTTLDEI